VEARAPARPWTSRDRALAARAVAALAGVALASGLVVAALVLLDLWAVWVLAAAVVLSAVQLLAGARLALTVAGARTVAREDEPALHSALERLCQLADLPKPRLALAETPAPLAFAVRRPGEAGAICLSRGVVDELPPEELEAVMAHELAHLAHHDALVMTVASSMAPLATLMLRFYWWSGIPETEPGVRRPPAWRIARWVMWGVSPLVSLAMVILRVVALVPGLAVALVAALTLPPAAALSRARELVADREAALLTGRPATLAAALTRIDDAMPAIPTRDLRRVSAVRALLIMPADTDAAWAWGLLRSHPPTAARVAALLELQRRLDAVPVS
jgi:heat shock protein HtpX